MIADNLIEVGKSLRSICYFVAIVSVYTWKEEQVMFSLQVFLNSQGVSVHDSIREYIGRNFCLLCYEEMYM